MISAKCTHGNDDARRLATLVVRHGERSRRDASLRPTSVGMKKPPSRRRAMQLRACAYDQSPDRQGGVGARGLDPCMRVQSAPQSSGL